METRSNGRRRRYDYQAGIKKYKDKPYAPWSKEVAQRYFQKIGEGMAQQLTAAETARINELSAQEEKLHYETFVDAIAAAGELITLLTMLEQAQTPRKTMEMKKLALDLLGDLEEIIEDVW